jgi:hypothetical protein
MSHTQHQWIISYHHRTKLNMDTRYRAAAMLLFHLIPQQNHIFQLSIIIRTLVVLCCSCLRTLHSLLVVINGRQLKITKVGCAPIV